MKLKISTTTFFLLLFACSALGQKSAISLSFTGIANGQYAQLSKIDIRNLNENCDTTLYWPDTVLSLIPVGTNDLHSFYNEFRLFQNIPNPVRENTNVMLYLPESGKVTVTVSLLTGKQVAFFSQELQRGYHSFLFMPGGAETYIFTAFGKGMKKSIKIVSVLSRSSSGCTLKYNGTENQPVQFKSAEMSGEYIFLVGDTLQFIGYYDSLTTAFQEAPTIDTLYTFNFPTTGISCPGMPAVTYLGQTYNTVQIGTQCWLRENLNVGTRIDGNQVQANNGIIEKYCYNNDENNCNIYGGIYQWNEMMQYVPFPGAQGICPSGWHIPTDAEWTTLTNYLGGENVAGGKMKEVGTVHWAPPNTGATNSSGFTALPGGGNDGSGHFANLTACGTFWSSSPQGGTNTHAWYRYLFSYNESVGRSHDIKTVGLSVRCLQD